MLKWPIKTIYQPNEKIGDTRHAFWPTVRIRKTMVVRMDGRYQTSVIAQVTECASYDKKSSIKG